MQKKVFIIIGLLISFLLLQFFCVWWSLIFPLFLIGYILCTNAWKSFFIGFLIVWSLWVIMAIYIDFSTKTIASYQMSSLLQINNKYLFICICGCIGGIVGALSSLFGYLLKQRMK